MQGMPVRTSVCINNLSLNAAITNTYSITWDEGDTSVVGESARARVVLVRTGVCIAIWNFGGVEAPEPGPDLCVCVCACVCGVCVRVCMYVHVYSVYHTCNCFWCFVIKSQEITVVRRLQQKHACSMIAGRTSNRKHQ